MVVKQDKVPFEDALSMAGFGKFNLAAFALCSSIIMGMTFEIFSVSYLVPSSACELHTTSTQQGLMAGVPLVGIILSSHVWGYLADTKGRRKILSVSMTLGFISGSLASLSPNWIVLSLLKFCSSASVSGAYALSLTLLSEYTPTERRSTLVLLTTSVFLSCVGLMALLSIPILPLKFSYYIPLLDIHFTSWRLLGLIFAFPSAICAVGVFCSYESPKFLLSMGREVEALKVLRAIFEINSGKDGDLYRVNSIVMDEESLAHTDGFWASIRAQTLPMLKPPLLKNTVVLSVLMFVVFICINPFIVWLPFIVSAAMSSVESGGVGLTLCEMIRQSRNSSAVEGSTDCSMNQFGMTVVFGINLLIALLNLVTSGVTSCFSRNYMFIGLQLLLLFLIISSYVYRESHTCVTSPAGSNGRPALVLDQHLLSWGRFVVLGGVAAILINFSTIWVISAVCFMVYLTGVINFASLTSFCVEIFPTYVKAMAVCLTLMVGRGSAVLGINLLKRLLDDDCELAFYVFGSITVAGGFIGLLLPSDKKLVQRKQALKDKLPYNT